MRRTAIGLIVLATVSATPGWVVAGSARTVTPQAIQGGTQRRNVFCSDSSGTNRFVDCGNGTVNDVQTGLIWLKNGDCYGLLTWWDASLRAATLASGQCGLADGSQAGDWRLPTLDEFAAILMPSCYPFPGGPTIPDKTGTACYLDGIHWATNVQSNVYWSSTEQTNPNDAWAMDLFSREVNGGTKAFYLYVWPVRSGQ